MGIEKEIHLQMYVHSTISPLVPTTLVMHTEDYKELVLELRARVVYVPTNPDKTFPYNGMEVMRTNDIKRGRVLIF